MSNEPIPIQDRRLKKTDQNGPPRPPRLSIADEDGRPPEVLGRERELSRWVHDLCGRVSADGAGTHKRTDAGSDPAGSKQAEAEGRHQRKKRGRKQSYDPEKDRKIAEAWTSAKESGVMKKDFAKDRNLSLRELNRCLNRHAKRARK